MVSRVLGTSLNVRFRAVVVVAAAIALHGHRSGSAQRRQLEPSPVGEVRGAGV